MNTQHTNNILNNVNTILFKDHECAGYQNSGKGK